MRRQHTGFACFGAHLHDHRIAWPMMVAAVVTLVRHDHVAHERLDLVGNGGSAVGGAQGRSSRKFNVDH